MKNTILIFILFMAQLSFFAQSTYRTNEVIVMMRAIQNMKKFTESFNTTVQDIQLRPKKTLSRRAQIYLLEFDATKTTVKELIYNLKLGEEIKYAQANHTHIISRNTVPNDLEYPVQWAMKNTAVGRIFAPQAWDISTDGITASGDTLVMAVVDGGVDTTHIDLNLFKNKHEIPNNGIDDDQNGYIDDYDGWNAFAQTGDILPDDHGTHVAGILGAITNNSEGIAGVIWGGAVMPISGSSNIESEVIEGYGYALEMRLKYNETNGDSGAFVVVTNSSFGLDMQSPDDFPIWCAFYDTLGAAGILNIAATSNSGVDIDAVGDIPTTCPSNYLVSVSLINENGSPLGGYGASHLDIHAPGVDIRSTTSGFNYGYKTGTSMACPHVAGVVGAMYSSLCITDYTSLITNPDSMTLWMKNALLETVDTVANLNGKSTTGGRLNMFKTLQKTSGSGIELSALVTPAADSNTNNGGLTVTPVGGVSPYGYEWNTGQTTASISAIGTDFYTVTVTDARGCKQVDHFGVWTVGISELDKNTEFTIAPNPSNGQFSILLNQENSKPLNVTIFDVLGTEVYSENIPSATLNHTILLDVAAGMYFLQLGKTVPKVIIVE